MVVVTVMVLLIKDMGIVILMIMVMADNGVVDESGSHKWCCG